MVAFRPCPCSHTSSPASPALVLNRPLPRLSLTCCARTPRPPRSCPCSLRQAWIPSHRPRSRPNNTFPDDTRPDLALRDPDGHLRLLVENKFWAGLTDAQPLAYLEALPAAPPSAVLFIAPHQRLTSLWPEIKRRLTGSFRLEREAATETLTWGRAGGRTLALTSWRHVLETLLEATADPILRRDIAQLRELTDQMNTDVFLPLSEAELSDVAVPPAPHQLRGLGRRYRQPPHPGRTRQQEGSANWPYRLPVGALPAPRWGFRSLPGRRHDGLAHLGPLSDLEPALQRRPRLALRGPGALPGCPDLGPLISGSRSASRPAWTVHG